MTNDDSSSAPKRFRSPPYPAINLQAAIGRATELHAKAMQHSVGWAVLADAWDYKVGSGSLGATAAALIQFGLLADDGSGDKRKFALTDAASRIIRDNDPQSEKRRDAIRKAALAPKIYEELWEKFGEGVGVSDVVLMNYLTLDRKDEGKAPYGDDAAQAVISEYKATVTFAGLAKSATVAPTLADKGTPGGSTVAPDPKLKPPPKVGDYVQWTSNGADQFPVAKRVEWVSEDGPFARVLGSHAGLPVSDLTVTTAPARAPAADPAPGAATPASNPIEVFMGSDGRLQVSANVDAAGLAKLRDLLSKYDEILTLMGGKPSA